MSKERPAKKTQIWMLLSHQEWCVLERHKVLDKGNEINELEGMWQDNWLRSQMSLRTKDYNGLVPYWGYFDPMFPNAVAVKLIADKLASSETDHVYVNLLVSTSRILLFPNGFWVDVFNRMYVGRDPADQQRFDDQIFQGNRNYGSPDIPQEIVTRIHESWDAFLDRRMPLQHNKRNIIEAVIGEIRLDDVQTAISLSRNSFLYPEYEPDCE